MHFAGVMLRFFHAYLKGGFMAQTAYTLGSASFDAVPEEMNDVRDLTIRAEATIGRGRVFNIGTAKKNIILSGKYMSQATRDTIIGMFDQCRLTGASASFNDGYGSRQVLIKLFETTPIIGKTQGFSFKIELIALG
jgi:hypothetical protein